MLNVSTWTRVCGCDVVFLDSVKWVNAQSFLLFSEKVNTHVFCNAVDPTVKRGGPPERLDRTKRL